jgi:hypothetical protein
MAATAKTLEASAGEAMLLEETDGFKFIFGVNILNKWLEVVFTL